MARVHRLLVERLGAAPVDAVLLDSPYGFQENADEISLRTIGYFRNLQIPLAVASWPTADDVLRRERALVRVKDANYVFSGPGSPTYALKVWEPSRLRNVLGDKLTNGGCVAFSSAAAATLGVATVPVYEIYKVGATPYWAPGLDLLAQLGLRAAVIPHYDNAEGGTHDTRCCYLGERRLRALESMLDADTVVLGVDEHTAAVFDLDANTVTVLGRAALTVRRQAISTVFPSGVTVPIDELRAIAAGGRPTIAFRPPNRPPPRRLLIRHHHCARRLTGWSASSTPLCASVTSPRQSRPSLSWSRRSSIGRPTPKRWTASSDRGRCCAGW